MECEPGTKTLVAETKKRGRVHLPSPLLSLASRPQGSSPPPGTSTPAGCLPLQGNGGVGMQSVA